MNSPVFLRIYEGDRLLEVKQFHQQQIVLGRNPDLDVSLRHSAISPIHAVIEWRETAYYVCDLGSETGIFQATARISDQVLQSGDELQMGPYRLEFFIGVPKPARPPQPLAAPVALATEPEGVEDFATRITEMTAVVPPPIPPAKTPLPVPAPVPSTQSGTFAPSTEWRDLDEVLKPGTGPVVEVIVAWRERILGTYHFRQGVVTMGPGESADVPVPVDMGGRPHIPFLKVEQLVTVFVPATADGRFFKGSTTMTIAELNSQRRLTPIGAGARLQLHQGEMIRLTFTGGLINIYIRYSADTAKPLVAPLLDLTPSETTGIILAAAVSLILALYMHLYGPDTLLDEENKNETYLAKIQFNPPPSLAPPVEMVEKKPELKEVEVKEKPKPPTPEPKPVAKVEPKEAAKGKPQDAKPTNAPIKKNQLVTIQKPGGSKKMGDKGASATTVETDPTKAGIFTALGAGGLQEKLSSAATGAGEITGLAQGKKGRSGFGEDRPGAGLGGALKNVGSGRGTETVGISGVGTKGKGGGGTGYGDGIIGERGKVAIEVGGEEAAFEGTVDKAAVRRVIIANKKAIELCYEMALQKDRSLYGKVVLYWKVGTGGKVLTTRVVTNELTPAVADCMMRRLRTWTFPDPPTDTYYEVKEYHFAFTSQ